MARGASSRQTRLFKKLIADLQPEIQKAFLESIKTLKRDIDWDALIAALTNKDIDAAIAALNIEPAVFASYQQAVSGAYTAGGVLAATTVNTPELSRVVVRFDFSNPRATQWIADLSATRISEESASIREAVRKTITEGYSAGRHPEGIARDIAGRMQGGRRVGGVAGLSPDLTAHVDRMRSRLRSGDPFQISKVKGMGRRDRTFDSVLDAAIAGRKLSDADIDRMVARYSDRLLAYRAERIARTETAEAVMAGRKETWIQQREKFGYPEQAVIKTWIHGGGVNDPRPDHQDMNGKSVVGMNTPFVFGSVQMQHAHDPSGGAAHNINCTCDTVFRLDHSYGLK